MPTATPFTANSKTWYALNISSTSDPNLDTDSGIRMLTVCVNGKPYRAAFITDPLVEIT